MDTIQLGIYHLPHDLLEDRELLEKHIYSNMRKNYYWSEDFTPEYYIAQAKAGFIAVTDHFEEDELLLPEIQFAYALLDFADLHISRKVQKLLKQKPLQIEISKELDEVAAMINAHYANCWLTERYLEMIKGTESLDSNFQMVSVALRDKGELIAGELGYSIGRTYTSLSGFSSKEKAYRNYGNAQLVLLGQFLEAQGFAFWNLGQPYMNYKLALGAKIVDREDFLKRWFAESKSSIIHFPNTEEDTNIN